MRSTAEDTASTPRPPRVRPMIQRFGGHLAAIVLPNVGAFIAWGLIKALFEPNGWTPNATIAAVATPMARFLIPVLLAYTGGKLAHGGQRGAVAGAIGATGVAVGCDVPMFFGAIIIGPLAGYLLKVFDRFVGARVAPGFRMLIDNFSTGVFGVAMAMAGVLGIGPAVHAATMWLADGVQTLLDAHLLPLASILIEPGKVLFLNNAINHGILGPIGAGAAATHGSAVEFLMEANPGPGLGILLACLLFGERTMRASAPGAIVIQFLGGIHEVYFPYVLARPRLVLAAIAGGAAGVLTFVVTGAGTVATPSPGSIFAVLAVTPRGGYFGVVAGVAIAALTSFAVASLLLGFGYTEHRRAVREARAARAARTARDGASEEAGRQPGAQASGTATVER